ncbi:FadR/GntR family transcriptional regulator [Pedobacter panaciterrae]
MGTFVDQLTANREPMDLRLKRANVKDLDEVRQLLEMKIAEKAALNRTESDIIIIRTHLENRRRAAKEGLIDECIEADVQFHISIAEASKNEILADLYKSASIHLKNWFLQTHSDARAFEETYIYHEQLLKSIIAGDPKKAWNIAAKILGHVSQ